MYVLIKKVTINIVTVALLSSIQLGAMEPESEQGDPLEHLILERDIVIESWRNLSSMQIPQEPTLPHIFVEACGRVLKETYTSFIEKRNITSSLIPQKFVKELKDQHKIIFYECMQKSPLHFNVPLDRGQLIALQQQFINSIIGSLQVSFNYLQAYYPEIKQIFGTFDDFWANYLKEQEDPMTFLKLEKQSAYEMMRNLIEMQMPQESITCQQFLINSEQIMIKISENFLKTHRPSPFLLPQDIYDGLIDQLKQLVLKKRSELTSRFQGPLNNEQLSLLRQEFIDHGNIETLKTTFNYLQEYYPDRIIGTFDEFLANN